MYYPDPQRLQTSLPPRRYVYNAPQLLDLHVSTSARLPRASRAPRLHVATLAARFQRSIPPVYLGLQRASRPPYLHITTSTTRLQTSKPLHLTSAAHLQHSAPVYFPIYIPTAHIQRSTPPDLHASASTHLQHSASTPYLRVSTSTCLQYTSSAPFCPSYCLLLHSLAPVARL